jgi:hypothetical protein
MGGDAELDCARVLKQILDADRAKQNLLAAELPVHLY